MRGIWLLVLSFLMTSEVIAQQGLEGTASIAGRVTDSSGNPCTAQVQLYQVVIRDGIGNVYPKCRTQTVEGGGFECAGLSEGNYIVQTFPHPRSAAASGRTAFMPVSMFYPGVTDLELATIVSLKEGERQWADFHVSDVRGVVISGVLTNHPSGAAISLRAEAGGKAIDTDIPVSYDDATGRFRFPSVAPGHYLLMADWFINGAQQRAAVPLLVGESPVDNIHISVPQNALVLGVVRNLPLDHSITEVRIGKTDGSREDIHIPLKGSTFAFYPVPPGEYILSLPSNAQRYVGSLMVGNQENEGGKFEVGQGQDQIRIDTELKEKPGAIRGSVAQWEGEATEGQVIAEEESSGRIAVASTDAERKFSFDGLAPGSYRLYAWPGVNAVEYRNRSFLDRYKDSTAEVTVDSDSIVRADNLHPIRVQP